MDCINLIHFGQTLVKCHLLIRIGQNGNQSHMDSHSNGTLSLVEGTVCLSWRLRSHISPLALVYKDCAPELLLQNLSVAYSDHIDSETQVTLVWLYTDHFLFHWVSIHCSSSSFLPKIWPCLTRGFIFRVKYWRTPSFIRKSMQVFVQEAPSLYFPA